MADVEIKSSVKIPISKIKPNDWNPNEQSEETFNQLVEEIKEDGFEQPLNVVPCKEVEGDYVIIGGEHRWKAATILGMSELPCYVHHSWNEQAQKLKTVRRNLISGKLNARKFSDLVEALSDTGIAAKKMPMLLGFEDQKEFDKHFISSSKPKEDEFIDDLKKKKPPVEAADSLMSIVAEIFKECDASATIDQNYLFFTVKGAVQVAIMCDESAWSSVEQMLARLRESGQTATEFICSAIDNQLKNG